MLGRNDSQPALFQMVDLEALVPADHRLRKLDAVLDLSFVREVVAGCYSAGRGRPSIDPELVIRMLVLGTLYNLSDRELCEEIGMHVGMRWFCRLNLHDPVPDHSTLSKLKERWAEAGVFETVFDQVVHQCAEAGLVSGRHVSIDGTQVQAKASMKSLAALEPKPDIAPAPQTPRDEVPDPAGPADPAPGSGRAKEPQPRGDWSGHGVKYSNQTHRSTSDPDARLYRKGKGKETRLCYLLHDLIDTKSRVILRRKVSRAHASAERKVALAMLDEVLAKQEALALPNRPEVASLDAGYGTGEFAADVLEREVLPHMPLLAGAAPEIVPTWQRRTSNLAQQRRRRERVRQARARNRVRELQKRRGYAVSRKLRIRSEHTFAEAKTRHGMDRARGRGCERVQVQADLVGIVQNLKRLVAFRGRKRCASLQARSRTPVSVRRSSRWARSSAPTRRRAGTPATKISAQTSDFFNSLLDGSR
ncbi:MAG TPA: IS5 family transposase [Longimicrobiaceae bacterium]|nr:IS5 family transposase [Longimicrobiaceae bacterium]